jgi:hypothetical protein
LASAARHRDFGRFRRERSRKALPFSFDFEGERYEFEVKPSFALMETIGSLEEEMAEKTKGDPELKKPENVVWVFRRCGEVCEAFMGAENWSRLKQSGFEVEDAIELVEWVGNELAAQRAEQAAEDDQEAEPDQEIDVDDPTAVPGGEGGPKSLSPQTTFSPAGAGSRQT